MAAAEGAPCRGLDDRTLTSDVPTSDRPTLSRKLLKRDHFAEQFECGSAVELPLDLLDVVDGAFDAAGAPVESEPGCHGVEVSEQVECEAGEAGELAGVDCVDPGGECGAEAVGEYLAEVADLSGRLVQFGAAGQGAGSGRRTGFPARRCRAGASPASSSR